MHAEDAGDDKLRQSLPVSATIQRRPWPRRRVSEAEEMVKYMSSIPRYLQHEENKHNIQEKALNVGVLDWALLQKRANHENPVTNKVFRDSTSSSNPSSLSPAFDSSPHSSRGNASPSAARKQPSTLDGQRPSKSSSTSDSTSPAEKDESKDRRRDSSKHIIKLQPTEIGSSPSASAGSEKQSRRKHLEEIIARSMSNFDTSLPDQQTKMSRAVTSLPPLSSEASSDKHGDGPYEGAKQSASFERVREHPPIFLPIIDLKGISGSPSKSINDYPSEPFAASSSSRDRRSPMRQFFYQPRKSFSSATSLPDVAGGRSSSRGRRSPAKQTFDPPLSSSTPDVSGSKSNSRSRRSPLRQMFESPRKSSSSKSSPQHQPHESCGVVDPPTCNGSSSSDVKSSPSTRQALLKLSWKNGLPLFMFSSSDDSILVAMMHAGAKSEMNVCDCFYEIHTAVAVEVKKKNGAWLSQATRSKKTEFTCKFAADLIVSSSEQVSFDHTRCSFKRELVLLGDELAPTNRGDAANLPTSSELAAIVVESPQQKSPTSCGIHCVPQIVAILPSDVHGLPNTREPSKLIERWESGGSCDCGGWDEGCALTVLTNNSQEMKNTDCSAVDGTSCGFGLYAEGDARRGKHSFRMVAFKEDMFTVEFRASIHLLQAFAISIAMLHDREHGGVVMEDYSFNMDNSEDLSFVSYRSISS